MAVAILCASNGAWAQASSTATTPPVTVVPPTATDLAGVPKGIQTLISNFNQLRDKFLAEQSALLIKLKHATTETERQQIRERLQANREAFLAALRDFRQQLKSELTALKGKISHEEFLRIIDAAHNAGLEGGLSHHRGH
ncbi:MAG TPA: hypothetical protein VGR14_08065 [Verrucomicrobiae bacterium]|nr:hypothetical protein [Verrucomicrobiae bacterium]